MSLRYILLIQFLLNFYVYLFFSVVNSNCNTIETHKYVHVEKYFLSNNVKELSEVHKDKLYII